MPFPHDVTTALPAAPANLDWSALRAAIIERTAVTLAASENPQDFVALDALTGARPEAIFWQRIIFWLVLGDTTSVHDGVTVLRTSGASDYCYTVDIEPDRIRSILSRTTAAQPAAPDLGDAYILPAAPTGAAWAAFAENSIAVYTGRGWLEVLPFIGQWIYVEDADTFARFTASGWQYGAGTVGYSAASIPLSALIGASASFILKVENQTTNAPPGARLTGGTPTVPLGGTAANINDNSAATTSTTAALGDLSAASIASRIIAKIDYGASKSIIAVDVKGLLTSTGTSTSQLYTSTDGTTWSTYGATLSVTAAAQDFQRTGAATARYIAVTAEAKNFAAATMTVGDLNGYDGTVTAAVDTAYVIGPSPFGIFAGHAGKVALCEAANTFTIYTPVAGDLVYDKSLAINVGYTGTVWQSAAGVWIKRAAPVITASGSTTTAGATAYDFSASVAPTSSQRSTTDDATCAHQATKAGTRNLRITYGATIAATAAGISGTLIAATTPFTLAIFRDAEANAIAWCGLVPPLDAAGNPQTYVSVFRQFLINAPDASSHTYKAAIMAGTVNSGGFDTSYDVSSLILREFAIEEAA